MAGEGGKPKPTAGACSAGRGPLTQRGRESHTAVQQSRHLERRGQLGGRKPVREGWVGLVQQRWQGPASGLQVEREAWAFGV